MRGVQADPPARLLRWWRPSRPRFADVLDAYFLDCRAAGHADSTIATRRRILGRLVAWLVDAGRATDLSEHDPAVAAAYLWTCRREGYAVSTMQLIARTLSAFSARASDLALIPRDVYRGLRILRVKRTVLVVLTRDEVARMGGDRWR